MKQENNVEVVQSADTSVESWVQEAQLSMDDLEAVVGGLTLVQVVCSTYCKSTYKEN